LAVLRFWTIFFFGFAVFNTPQCPPHILFQTCVFLSGSADLLYVEPKDSDTNLTSHFLELLPDIIIQDYRKAPHILFMNVNL